MPSDYDFSHVPNHTPPSNLPPHPAATTLSASNAGSRRRRMQISRRSPQTGRQEMEISNTTADITEGRQRRARVQEIQAEEINQLRAAAPPTISSSRTAGDDDSLATIRSRLRAMPSQRHLQRQRLRPQLEGDAISHSISSVQDAVERLTEASSNLSSLLDEPIPHMISRNANSEDYLGEPDANRRRTKRRKLDSDSLGGSLPGFSYGYHGQVVPGPLKMEIVSCDGGHYNDSAGHGRFFYWPENVLRNDKSVYCTETNRCNIILRHQGETPFCLKKLVIKAPATGFTAPIQEGLIFISMTSDELLPRTAQYHLRESIPPPPPPPPPPPLVVSDGNLGPRAPHRPPSTVGNVQTTMGDYNDNRPPSRRADYPSARVIPAAMLSSRPRPLPRREHEPVHLTSADDQFPLINLGDDSTPPPRTLSPPIPPLFNVSITCDEPSGDEEEESSPATLADRSRRDRMLSSSPSSSEDDVEEGWTTSVPRDGPYTGSRRRRRRATPSKIEWAVDGVNEDAETEMRKKVEVLAPHARFFIEREKSMVSIKFDPPVSGKFILLKLWSPAKDQNIDIQSIVAHGYAGTRFFPSVQMM